MLAAHQAAPEGMIFHASIAELRSDTSLVPYWQAVNRAWHELNLSGVLTLEGKPTLYLAIRSQRVSPEDAADLQCQFWNHGLATIFVLIDPVTVRIYSGLAKPEQAVNEQPEAGSLVEALKLTEYVTYIQSFFLRLATGSYYQEHNEQFNAEATVDAYLLNNLRTLRDTLIDNACGLSIEVAHTLLARVLFVCYLTDRGIINLGDLEYGQCNTGAKLGEKLADLSTVADKQRVLLSLFKTLKENFNGNMFEDATLTECRQLNRVALVALENFLLGHDLGTGQYTLDFWAYNFSMIPVETISAVYEDFLKKEDQPGKHNKGAYYTPRFLAETVIDLALRESGSLVGKRFLDPSCGSGIFLVTLFNRLSATWMQTHPKAGYDRKADALKKILREQIRGVDVNPTACRIACFSLYLAFLDGFSPPDIEQYIERKGKLPNILRHRVPSADSTPEFPVIFEDDFLTPSNELPDEIDFIVGNPPWAERGAAKGMHHRFARKIPQHLSQDGIGCILLPSKMFLNEKTNDFQAEWLQQVTVDEVVQLADYRKILFKEARCPCMIVRFREGKPDLNSAQIEYVAPKVSRAEYREGLIPVAASDRKSISLKRVVHAAKNQAAPVVWKNHLWGTPRDIKFLDMLEEFPKLGDIAGTPKENKRWIRGQGFQPDTNGTSTTPTARPWKDSTLFVQATRQFPAILLLEQDCTEIGKRYPVLHRIRDQRIYQAPLILVSQGIGQEALPKVAFSYRQVVFQDSLQAICGPSEDEDLLLFLTVYLRSKLASYYLFNTAANWGTERDKILFSELMRLPFPLPDTGKVDPKAKKIVREVARNVRKFKSNIEQSYKEADDIFTSNQREQDRVREGAKLQAKLENKIYNYFGLIDQEIALVEDTVNVVIPSATPTNFLDKIPAQTPINNNHIGEYEQGLAPYAEMLAGTLNTWAAQSKSKVLVSITGGVHEASGMACVSVSLGNKPASFTEKSLSDEAMFQVLRLARTESTQIGNLDYVRGLIVFDGPSIHIFKPVALIGWTRTAALNDAAEIYARIATVRSAIETGK